MNPASKHTAEHYTWGEGCDGWHLLKSDNLSVIQESMPPGTAEVPHYHRYSRQFFFILEGEIAIRSPEGDSRLCVGEGVHIAPGIMHRVSNAATAPSHFLVISSPPSHGDRVLSEEVNE